MTQNIYNLQTFQFLKLGWKSKVFQSMPMSLLIFGAVKIRNLPETLFSNYNSKSLLTDKHFEKMFDEETC